MCVSMQVIYKNSVSTHRLLRSMLSTNSSLKTLADVALTPVVRGKLDTSVAPITAKELWAEKPALIFAVRRPG